MIVYITAQGSKIRRDKQRLLFIENNEEQTIFAGQLEQLVLYGNVSLTGPARSLLLREGIDTHFLRLDGRYMGRLHSTESGNVALRKRQFDLVDEFCRSYAGAHCLS